ncbi:MAG: hypothetical protein K1X89_07765 [Myxococcaceae bacterium]|nr:hypothetical protein [Myxococcaceae bacterium]
MRASRPPPRFTEVNPRLRSAAFTQTMGQALALLQRWNTPVARHTLAAIERGEVKVDELADLTSKDFARVRKQLAGWGAPLDQRDFRSLHDQKSKASRTVRTMIDGYAWDNRIYLHPDLTPREMATTLAHEVNHVLNRSEEHYRTPKAVLREEYRAFLAARLATGEVMTPRKCRLLKEQVISNYELDGVTADDVPDLPPGVGLR